MIIPVGEGIGATQEACKVWSVIRAAGMPPINTVGEPWMIMPGPAGTQPGSMQGIVWSEMRAAGMPPIITVGSPGGMIISGKPGCGTGVGTSAGG